MAAPRAGAARSPAITKGTAMPSIGPMELVIVMIIALLILGPKRLPEMGRSVGQGMRSFKEAVTGAGDDEPAELPEPTAAQR